MFFLVVPHWRNGGIIMDQMWKSGVKIEKKKEAGGVFVLPRPEQSSKSDQMKGKETPG